MKTGSLPFLIVVLLLGSSASASAQAVPDTSTDNIIRTDSLAHTRRLPDSNAIASNHLRQPLTTHNNLPTPFQPIPKRAALFSAMLPGAGQYYNRQYWKMGVVYGLAGVATYFLIDNTRGYQKYRKAYVARLTDPTVNDEYTNLWSPDPNVTRQNLQTLQDYYKRNLDLTILLSGVGYALQVLDALAFAHLRNFDVSPNISLHLKPVSTPLGGSFGIVATIHSSWFMAHSSSTAF